VAPRPPPSLPFTGAQGASAPAAWAGEERPAGDDCPLFVQSRPGRAVLLVLCPRVDAEERLRGAVPPHVKRDHWRYY
jgi:hypothetical protein